MKLLIIILIIALLFAFGVIVYIHFIYTGKIEDKDKDYIPDVVEDRLDRVAEEIDDIAQDIADAIDGVADVFDAAQGSKRKGRPKKNSN
jgi:hypothetical protein